MWSVLKKFGLVLLVLLLILSVASILFVRSGVMERWAKDWVIQSLENRFDVRVELDRVQIRVIGTQVDLYNFKIFNRIYPAAEPLIGIDHILVDFSITHFFLPSASLDRLILDSPRFRLIEDPNERLNFSNVFFPEDRSREDEPDRDGISFMDLAIKQLRLNRGLLIYKQQPVSLDSAEGGMETTLRFSPREQKYVGHTNFQHLDLSINGLHLPQMATSLDFEFLENEIRVPLLEMNSPALQLRARGGISDLRDLIYRFQSDFSVDLTELKEPDLRSHFQQGILSLSGVFSGDGDDFVFEGEARSAKLQFKGFPFEQVRATLNIDRQRLLLSELTTRFYRGVVETQGRLGWEESEASQFDVNASRVQIYPLLSDLGRQDVHARGIGNFKGSVRWPGLHWNDLSGQGAVSYRGDFSSQELVKKPIPTPIPFEGQSRVSFTGETVRLSAGLLQTPESVIEYRGKVGFTGDYRFNFDLVSQQSNELVRMAAYTTAAESFIQENRLRIQGPTSLSATLEGSQGRIKLAGTLNSEEVSIRDEFVGDFQTHFLLSDSTLELTEARILGPRYRVNTSLRLIFDTGEVALLDDVELHLTSVPLERLVAILEHPVPIEGQLSGDIRLEQITPSDYQANGQISVSDLTAYGQNLDQLNTNFRVQGKQLFFEEVRGSIGSGTISGQAQIDLENQTYEVDLSGEEFPLQAIQALQERVPVQGSIDFALQGKGSAQSPNFTLSASASRIEIDQYPFTNVELHTTASRSQIDFRLRSDSLGSPLAASGTAGLVEPYPIDARIDVKQVSLAPYLRLAGIEQLEGTATGSLSVEGPAQEIFDLRAQAEFSNLELFMAGYEISNQEPVELSYQSGILSVRNLKLRGADTELQIEGTVGVRDNQNLNLEVNGLVNLLAVNSFLPTGTTAGRLQVKTVIAGTLDTPRIVGSAQLKEGFFVHPDLPTTLFDVQGDLRFTANQVSLDNISAQTTYGSVAVEGGIFLEGIEPTRWQINIFGQGLRLEYPTDVISVLDVDLDLIKSEVSQLISGAVYIRSAEYTQDISIPQLIFEQARSEITDVSAPTGEEIALDVTVEAYQSLGVNNNLADAVASADLTVRGTLQNPVILGSITVDEGQLFLENNDYEIVRGTVNFNNPRRTRPILNFEAETQIREFNLSVLVQGPLDNPRVTFRSDPPLPIPSIVSLLAVGQTQEEIFGPAGETRGQFGNLAVYGAGALLSKSIGERLEARTSRLFGFEKFSIDPFLSTERDPGARITLGKDVTEDLSVTYSTNLASNQQGQIVVFQYRITDWLTAVGTREEDGSVAVDFKLRKRF